MNESPFRHKVGHRWFRSLRLCDLYNFGGVRSLQEYPSIQYGIRIVAAQIRFSRLWTVRDAASSHTTLLRYE